MVQCLMDHFLVMIHKQDCEFVPANTVCCNTPVAVGAQAFADYRQRVIPFRIEAVINNARCFQKIRQEHGSFCDWLWAHTDGKTVLYMGHENGRIPVSNGLSDEIAKELKAYGFKYLGTVTVYSHLQACGIVNDHAKECPCYQEINAHNPTVRKRRCLEK